MPLTFPPLLTGPGTPIPRSIGAIQLNDRINTYFDQWTPPWPGNNQYQGVIHRNGEMVRTRRDFKGPVVEMSGYWMDGSGKTFLDFLDELAAIDKQPLRINTTQMYEKADVVDVISNRVVAGFDGGVLNEVWKWSIKFQCYSALRVPVP